jgi:hypothetical protein
MLLNWGEKYYIKVYNCQILFSHNKLKLFKISTLYSHTYFSNGCLQFWILLSAFPKLRKAITSFVMSVCISVFPPGTPRRPMDRFSWNLMLASTLPHKRQDFREKKKLLSQNVFWFSLQLFYILRRTERDMIKNAHRTSCKVTAMLVLF